MRFEGKVRKDGRLWLIEIPLLNVMTQGRSRKEAFEMIKDAIESLVNREGFEVTVYPGRKNMFEVGASDTGLMVSLLLRRQREAHGLPLSEVSRRLNQSSPNAYARYEQGKSVPTVEKLRELMSAVNPGGELVVRESRL